MRIYGCDHTGVAYLITIDGVKYKIEALIDGNWTFQARASYEELMILSEYIGVVWQ